MDVSDTLKEHAEKLTAARRLQEEAMEGVVVDAALLAAFDERPIEAASEYSTDLEAHLLELSTRSTQALLATLFNLPTTRDPSLGPLAVLPSPPLTKLPREKPLPKPKPLTRWERFAKAKGISHVKKDKMVFDEELQKFVPRWGRHGKNKDTEEAWIRVVKAGEDADHDPIATARRERKERVAKNERQRQRNVADAATTLAAASSSSSSSSSRPGVSSLSAGQKAELRTARKKELERSMMISKSSTASMGKFDKKIEGEPKIKGVKRKFDSNTRTTQSERESMKAILGSVGSSTSKASAGKRGGEGREGDVNARKAVRFAEREKRRKGGK